MKTKLIRQLFLTATVACVGFTSGVTAQEVETAREPANPGEAPSSYPVETPIQGEALQRFAAFFEPQNVGFFHVYADPEVDPEETYLLRGNKMGGVALQMLPKKFRKRAKRMGADVYGAGAIRGMNENLYLVRMDGNRDDRIEMFAIRDGEVTHLKTLATMTTSGSRKKQMDSYITDIDGDSYLDLMTAEAGRNGEMTKKTVFILDNNSRSWKKTSGLDAPWGSAELYRPNVDD